MRMTVVLVGILALGSMPGAMAEAPKPAPPPPKACATPEYRQFDFWLGDWSVSDPKGNAAGTNLITLEQDGCVLHEHWTGSKGGTGQSFNVYDATDKRWHQVWVDNQGGLLQLTGGIVDAKMVLEGPGRGAKGESVTNRITWEKLADGRVRQTWTVSRDAGKTWAVSFDGYYSKK